MKGRKGRFLFTLFLTLLVFGFGTRIVRADETDNFQSDKKSIYVVNVVEARMGVRQHEA